VSVIQFFCSYIYHYCLIDLSFYLIKLRPTAMYSNYIYVCLCAVISIYIYLGEVAIFWLYIYSIFRRYNYHIAILSMLSSRYLLVTYVLWIDAKYKSNLNEGQYNKVIWLMTFCRKWRSKFKIKVKILQKFLYLASLLLKEALSTFNRKLNSKFTGSAI
jgi:hypothetical protein